MRSSNLREVPRWITPDMVRRILEIAIPLEGRAVPVVTVPTRGVKPKLEIVENRPPKSPVSRRPEEREAAIVAPHVASPRRPEAAKPPKPAPKVKPSREVAPAPVRQTVASVPSREPALPAPRPARAHPIPQPLGRPTGIFAYAERMRRALEHLRSRHFVVRRHDPDEVIGRWQVTGQHWLLSNEEVVELAITHGLELQA